MKGSNLEKAIANWQEIIKKNQGENNRPDGYMNCKRDACAFGLGDPCEKHKLIRERQKREERIAREQMRACRIS